MPLPTWANVNVADEPLLIRQESSTNSPFISVLQDGTPVNVVAFSEDGKWSQISSPYEGWVSNDFLLFISEDSTHSSVRLHVQQLRTRYEVKVHAAPVAGTPAIDTLSSDQVVVVAATIGDPPSWYQIADPSVGWVAADDLAPAFP
jgi:hypothetical protein